jgi:aspartate kinase
MALIVHKYGGTSVSSIERIKNVARRVAKWKAAGRDVVLVPSAMSGETNRLIALAKEVQHRPDPRELDVVASTGEQVTIGLLAMALLELGINARSYTGAQVKVLTDSAFTKARIQAIDDARLRDDLARGVVPVVAGFQGVDPEGNNTTLGRGGSDTTAVALAAALGAEYCEICSDVDGVYTGDPRVVDAATLLQAISCDEMLELASHGAKVLHAGCVEIARRTGIALYARATAGGGEGTRIDLVGAGENVDAVGVTGQKKLVRVRSRGEGCVDRVLAAASAAGVPALHLDTDMESADLWFGLADVPDWPAIRARLEASLEILEGVGAVSVVGDGIGGDTGKLQRARRVAAEAGIEIVAMSTSPLRVSLFCEEAKVDALVRVLHGAFRERP